jgi:hypothetical protein
MTKVHTRKKRQYDISPHLNGKHFFTAIPRVRPKTFKSELAAKEYAKEQKLAESSYSLKIVKNNKRFQIVKVQDST